MSRAISVRLDNDSERALARLEASGLSQSDAIRRALVDSAKALGRKCVLRQEVEALEADEEDRREMLAVASLMETMRAPR